MTAGYDWSELGEVSQDYLTRYQTKEEAKNSLGLSPFTGQVCGLGIYDLERKEQVIYIVSEVESVNYRSTSEANLLEDFWEGLRSYDVLVTFGGRRFDLPFIYHRTIAKRLKPSIDLPRVRNIEKQKPPYHVDLHDEFTFQGSLRSPVTLNFLAETYGLDNPDTITVNGGEVNKFFKEREYEELAKYCESNIQTTAKLYEIWLTKLAPNEFLNSLQ